ncbi:hypothetical protein TrCOL_g4334 [Triparma columacea]|uniref:Proteasome activator PA28 C-terminal domain-containing protein n=1 Tax=Triparma columacea TaxID=722753 RepID=A0A9W7L9X8_9STRA|nr:hypothetical protein TrCOL_g4334 [Triparma columacea]
MAPEPSSITLPCYEEALSKMLPLADEIHALLSASFPDDTTAAVRSRFATQLTSSVVLTGVPNSEVSLLLSKCEPLLESVQSKLWHITRHIHLLTPKVEDGNNFGADVQSLVLKFVQEKESLVSGYMGDYATYFWQRGNCMEKIGGPRWRGDGGRTVVEEEVKVGSEGDDREVKDEEKTGDDDAKDEKGGSDAKGKKRKAAEPVVPTTSSSTTSKKTSSTSTKTTTTTKTSTSTPNHVLPDYLSYLVSLDVKWYLYLKDSLRQAADSCLMVKDMVEKNRDKIEHPKGPAEGGQNGMSMF